MARRDLPKLLCERKVFLTHDMAYLSLGPSALQPSDIVVDFRSARDLMIVNSVDDAFGLVGIAMGMDAVMEDSVTPSGGE